MISARPLSTTLAPLFVIQFLSWAGMFCMWIYAVTVIAGDVFHVEADPVRYGTALAGIGACYALYAILGASMAFVLPSALQRFGVRIVYGFALAIGACGIGALGVITKTIWLVPAFMAIGVGWCGMSNIPYAVVSNAAPEGQGDHLMRVFGFSTVVPQASMTLLLAFVGPRLPSASTHLVLVGGGVLMASAALVAMVVGDRFAVSTDKW